MGVWDYDFEEGTPIGALFTRVLSLVMVVFAVVVWGFTIALSADCESVVRTSTPTAMAFAGLGTFLTNVSVCMSTYGNALCMWFSAVLSFLAAIGWAIVAGLAGNDPTTGIRYLRATGTPTEACLRRGDTLEGVMWTSLSACLLSLLIAVLGYLLANGVIRLKKKTYFERTAEAGIGALPSQRERLNLEEDGPVFGTRRAPKAEGRLADLVRQNDAKYGTHDDAV